jgi:hypothetical protein
VTIWREGRERAGDRRGKGRITNISLGNSQAHKSDQLITGHSMFEAAAAGGELAGLRK